MSFFAGYKIVTTADHPVRTLAEDVPVSPEFRIEVNLWMRAFFGTYCLLADGQCLVMERENKVIMNERTYAEFKRLHNRGQV